MAKKASKQRARPLTGEAKRIKYKCNGSCRATPKFAHMSPGDVVVLIAVDTDVTIDFKTASPFESGADPITITEGAFRAEVVGTKAGSFAYTLTCSTCASSHGDPEMIVP